MIIFIYVLNLAIINYLKKIELLNNENNKKYIWNQIKANKKNEHE